MTGAPHGTMRRAAASPPNSGPIRYPPVSLPDAAGRAGRYPTVSNPAIPDGIASTAPPHP